MHVGNSYLLLSYIVISTVWDSTSVISKRLQLQLQMNQECDQTSVRASERTFDFYFSKTYYKQFSWCVMVLPTISKASVHCTHTHMPFLILYLHVILFIGFRKLLAALYSYPFCFLFIVCHSICNSGDGNGCFVFVCICYGIASAGLILFVCFTLFIMLCERR